MVRGVSDPVQLIDGRKMQKLGLRPAHAPDRATGCLLFQTPSPFLRLGGMTRGCEKAFHRGAVPLSRNCSVCVALRKNTLVHPGAVRWEDAPTWYASSL